MSADLPNTLTSAFDGMEAGKLANGDRTISVDINRSSMSNDAILDGQTSIESARTPGIEPRHYHRCSKAHGRVIAGTVNPFSYELDASGSAANSTATNRLENGDVSTKALRTSRSMLPTPKAQNSIPAVNGISTHDNSEFSPADEGKVPEPAVFPEPYPYPKWPANHKSAAFESVAVKKSFILSPPEIYAECAHHGEEKSKYQWYKMMMLTTIAGCYVGFGFTLCLQVGGSLFLAAPAVGVCDPETNSTGEKCTPPDPVSLGFFKLIFGTFGFPFGFTTIVVCGAELYTSLCAYMMAAFWEGKVNMLTCLRVWAVSWCGNFAGCLIFVGLMKAGQVYEGKSAYMEYLAHDKTHHEWGVTLVKAIFANWLVGIATWMANAAQDLTGKAVGIFLPISAFASIGFEHCIANMFLIPMAIAMGADITAKEFLWNNLVPATLGNWIGGAICLSTVYAFTYGRPPLVIKAWYAQWCLKRKLT